MIDAAHELRHLLVDHAIHGERFALVVISDGRDRYARASIASAAESLPPVFCQIVHVDDRDHALGFAGAIRRAWDQLEDVDWIFHLEADFTFTEPVDLLELAGALRGRRGWLSQIVLKRQPWNPEEVAAGGIVEQHPDDYVQWSDGRAPTITLHDRFFSTNPCLYHRRITEYGWPQEEQSEGKFTALLRAEGYRFAFWGGKFAAPTVEHIGVHRAGTGY